MSGMPAIILVQPQLGENIGAAARAMYNFGLTELRLVNPRDGWPNDRAGATAAAAGTVIDNAQVFSTTQEALANLSYIYALTVRPRDMTKSVLIPETAIIDSISKTRSGHKVGFMFGPERSGLENTDIVQANKIVSVPVNTACPSINLAQCVLLMSYEWSRQRKTLNLSDSGVDTSTYASVGDVQKLTDFVINTLESRDFFVPVTKKTVMQESIRNMTSRVPVTQKDIQTLWGAVRTLTGKFQKR